MEPTDCDWNELLRHGGFLRLLARDLVGRDAEDLVQSTWLRAAERPPADPSRSAGWLRRVMTRLAADRRRTDGRRLGREAAAAGAAGASAASAADVAANLDEQRAVVEAVRALDEKQRVVVYLRYYEGLGPAAIAARLGSPLDTIRTRLQRALAQLRERLDERDRELRRASGRWCVLLAPLAGSAASKAVPSAVVVRLAAALLLLAVPASFLFAARSSSRAAGDAVSRAASAIVAAPANPAALAVARSESRARDGERSHRVVGTVLDELLQPIAGASVLVRARTIDPDPAAILLETTTDEQGRYDFVIDAPPYCGLEVRRAGTTTARVSLPLAPEVQRCVAPTIWLHAARTLRGVVVDPEHRPISGARLLAFDEVSSWQWLQPEACSGADGSFTITDAPLTPLFVNAFARGFAPAHVGPINAATATIECVLAPQASPVVAIRTSLAAGAAPDPRVVAHFSYKGASDERADFRMPRSLAFRRLDEQGTLRCDDLPAGRYRVSLTGAHVLRQPRDDDLTLVAGAASEVSFELAAHESVYAERPPVADGVALRGRVLTTSGAAAADVEVRLVRDDEGRSQVAAALTDGDGSFEFSAVPKQAAPLLAELRGWFGSVTATKEVAVDGRASPELEWRVPEACFVRGRLRLRDGGPCPARVVLARLPAGGEFTTHSTSDGRFVIGPLPPEVVPIWIYEWKRHEPVAKRGFDLRGGRSIADVDWVVDAVDDTPPPKTRLTWDLRWSDGAPVLEGGFFAHQSFGGSFGVTWAPESVNCIDIAEENPARHALTRGFWAPQRGGPEWSCSEVVEGTFGGPPIVLTLARPAERAAITARLAELAQLASRPAPVMIDWTVEFDDGGRMPWTFYGRCPVVDGALELRGFPSGHFSLELQPPGLPAARREFDVVGTGTVDLGAIWFGELPHFRGVVVDEHGAPIEGALVQPPWLRERKIDEDPDEQPRHGAVRSGADGRFEYVGDLADSSMLVVTKPGWMKKQVDGASPTAGRVVDLGEIVLLPSGAIELVRIPADVNGVRAWKLHVEDVTPGDRFGYRATTSDVASAWPPRTKLGPLPIGRYVVSFYETGSPPDSTSSSDRPPQEPSAHHAYRWEVGVRAGETTTIDVGKEW